MKSRVGILSLAWVLALALGVQAQDDSTLVEVGDTVFGYWRLDGYWYCGQVARFSGSEVLVHWSHDDTENWLPEGQVAVFRPQPGGRVEANWKWGGKYYPGVIRGRDGDRFLVDYDDGDQERVAIGQLRVNLYTQTGFQFGQMVYAYWPADGYWYPGEILQVEADRCEVRYCDGEVAWRQRSELSTFRPGPGDSIQVCQRFGATFYRAVVDARYGRKLQVVYDNGAVGTVDAAYARADLGVP